MLRPSHLTRSDVRFLAGVSADPVRKLADITELAGELEAAAQARGLEADLSPLLDVDDESVLVDPDALDEIRADLAGEVGAVGRGELIAVDEGPSWTAEMLREVAQLKQDMGIDIETTEETDEHE